MEWIPLGIFILSVLTLAGGLIGVHINLRIKINENSVKITQLMSEIIEIEGKINKVYQHIDTMIQRMEDCNKSDHDHIKELLNSNINAVTRLNATLDMLEKIARGTYKI